MKLTEEVLALVLEFTKLTEEVPALELEFTKLTEDRRGSCLSYHRNGLTDFPPAEIFTVGYNYTLFADRKSTPRKLSPPPPFPPDPPSFPFHPPPPLGRSTTNPARNGYRGCRSPGPLRAISSPLFRNSGVCVGGGGGELNT